MTRGERVQLWVELPPPWPANSMCTPWGEWHLRKGWQFESPLRNNCCFEVHCSHRWSQPFKMARPSMRLSSDSDWRSGNNPAGIKLLGAGNIPMAAKESRRIWRKQENRLRFSLRQPNADLVMGTIIVQMSNLFPHQSRGLMSWTPFFLPTLGEGNFCNPF